MLRGHPKTVLLALILLLLSGTVGGLYGYGAYQWRAAELAVKERRLDDARTHLRRCLFLWPRSVSVHLLAARADRLSGDLDGAEAHLNECRRLNHGPSEAIQLEYLLRRVQLGDQDEVAEPLMVYVEKNDPDTALILETLSAAYIYKGRYRAAATYLTRWIQLMPEASLAYYLRGVVDEQLGGLDAALQDYQKAVDLDADFVRARLRLAEMWLEKNNAPEARPHLERLCNQFPDRADILARLGQCRFLEGNEPEARRLLEAAEKQLPNDPDLLMYLAKLDMQDRPAEAEKRLRRVLEREPFAIEPGFALADCLRLQGREKEADAAREQFERNREILTRAHSLLKDEADYPSISPERPTEAGTLLLRVGQPALGVYWLQEALRRDPRNEPALKALAEHYEKTGDAQQAAQYRERLAKVEKKNTSP